MDVILSLLSPPLWWAHGWDRWRSSVTLLTISSSHVYLLVVLGFGDARDGVASGIQLIQLVDLILKEVPGGIL